VLELKRSTVSVDEGVIQNRDNQLPTFIGHFFSTIQLVMAGNDTQGLKYGTVGTPENSFYFWREDSEEPNLLDRALLQMCEKNRILEIIHDFIVFDSGNKKTCRVNQYFGVKAAQQFALERKGGVIWHTQGSGKSLTMVWLAKWIKENIAGSRVLIVTDRVDLDKMIDKVFKGVDEKIHKCSSGGDLIDQLNKNENPLLCSLIHKFASRSKSEEAEGDVAGYLEQITRSLPKDFSPKGEIFVFIDECHRTQTGKLHKAMKEILPKATIIGFTGTPILKKEKAQTMSIFGPFIHTYKYDEAVRDKVIVDIRYEARDVAQKITSQEKIDLWMEAKTANLNDVAKSELKKTWATMQNVLSSRSRLEVIVGDIVLDMATRPRLLDDRGNAILVASSIFEACIFYELFQKTPLKGKVQVITSYQPQLSDIKGETVSEGETLPVQQFKIYGQMLADWFDIPSEDALRKTEEYTEKVTEAFIDSPAQVKLLIVVDKLLTGFDAPSATYLYIDKPMRDHGLFQAICRVNRVDPKGEDKEYGYVVDYKDLFMNLEGVMTDYTSAAFDAYDPDDIKGMIKSRVVEAKENLLAQIEATEKLLELVERPKETPQLIAYFVSKVAGSVEEIKSNEPKRLAYYRQVSATVRAFANLAGDELEAGYTAESFHAVKKQIEGFDAIKEEIKLASGDFIDLKSYEPDMRHLIDTYIKSEESRKITTLGDTPLLQAIARDGIDGAIKQLPPGIKKNREAVAEVIINNVRKLIISERPVNPIYYDKMSVLLDALLAQNRQQQKYYEEFLEQIVALIAKVQDPAMDMGYPVEINTPGRRAFYDLLGYNHSRALEVEEAIIGSAQDEWKDNHFKTLLVRQSIEELFPQDELLVEHLLELAKNQREY
jgi:type I restriction enzyme R subunit